MRFHRFFIEEKLEPYIGKEINILNEELVHQWRHVLRFQVGHELILLDNSGYEFHVQIVQIENKMAKLKIVSSEISKNTPEIKFKLYISLPKRNSFELILEKGTELGVSEFIPVISERSEKKSLNIERSQKIIKEASEQSGRAILPVISEVKTFDESINQKESAIAFDPQGKEMSDDFKKNIGSEISVFVGPEGGWSPREISLFENHSIPVYSVGPQILRSETAAIAIISVLLLG